MIYYNPPWVGIIDISGHGVAAALVSMLLRTIFDIVLSFDPPLHGVPFLIENELKKYQLEDIYFTAILGKLENDVFKFLDIAHPSPVNISKKEILNTINIPPIGFGFSEDYTEEVVNVFNLSDGKLLLYTDGITEEKTKNGMLTTEGLVNLVSPDDNLEMIYLKVLKERMSSLQEDDVTMILLQK